MIEKSTGARQVFQKKITAYLDGSLSPEERSEFEAFVATHPEFQSEVRTKQEEIDKLRSLMPKVTMSPRTREAIDQEVKQAVMHFLKQEPKSLVESLKSRFEEWKGLSR